MYLEILFNIEIFFFIYFVDKYRFFFDILFGKYNDVLWVNFDIYL